MNSHDLPQDEERPGYKKIFRPWRTNPVTGLREYPKNARVFVMWIKDDSIVE